jgi:DNA primase
VESAPRQAYQKERRSSRRERRGVSRSSVIDEANAKVPVIDFADRLVAERSGTRWRKVGDKRVTLCMLPDHQERTPSFTVYADNDRGWWCFGCARGGDAVQLACYAWGYEKHEAAMAAADLLHEFGHELPERPASWYAKEQRQKPVRDGIEAAKILVVRRRLYRRFFEPLVLATEDPEDRAHDAQLFWELTARLAERLVGSMMELQR